MAMFSALSVGVRLADVIRTLNNVMAALESGPVSPAKKLVDFKATTDLWTNVTLGIGWNAISGAQAPSNIPAFTVSDGAAFVLITLALGIQVAAPTVAGWLASGVYIDGAFGASLGGLYAPATLAYPQWSGGGSVLLPLAPGSHTIEPRVYASAAIDHMYLRAGSVGTFEFLRLGVVEVH